jgi:hypothetical protein
MKLCLLATLGVGSFIEGVGALTTAFSVAGGLLTFQLLQLNLPWLVQGNLDVWWLTSGRVLSSSVVTIATTTSILGLLWSSYYVIVFRRTSRSVISTIIPPKVAFDGKTKTMGDVPSEPKT